MGLEILKFFGFVCLLVLVEEKWGSCLTAL